MHPKVKRALRAAKYEDGGSVDDRSPLRRAVDTGMDYAGRGLALADLYSGGMLTSVAGLNPFGSYNRLMEAREQALDAVPREAKAMATEPISPVAAIFAGPMARTANKTMLRRAEELVAQNAPREQIWNETGWFKGVDGKWRFEIDDSHARYRPDFSGNKMPDALDHEQLYNAYPDFRIVPVSTTKLQDFRGRRSLNGYYSPDKGVVIHDELGTKTGRSTSLHELQHKIQDDEGFARGANPAEFKKVENDRQMLSDANVLAVMMSGGKSAPEALAEFEFVMRRKPSFGAESVALSGERPSDILARRDALLDPMEAYRRTAGEVEARAVQKRMDMPPHYRKFRAPWLDYDVPEQDQIVRFRP